MPDLGYLFHILLWPYIALQAVLLIGGLIAIAVERHCNPDEQKKDPPSKITNP